MRGLQHVKGIGLPSQTGRMIGVMKTKLRQAHALASHLRAMHYLFPTPRAVVIDCPQDEIAFQRCFSDVRQRFAGHRVRICVALSCRESLTVLNCLIPILNATGQDPTSLPCPILVSLSTCANITAMGSIGAEKKYSARCQCFVYRVFIYFKRNTGTRNPWLML